MSEPKSSKLTMSRRTFVKAAAVTGAATVLAGSMSASALAADATTSTQTGVVKHIRTSCRGCGKMECGTWATVENGKVTKIEGDESAFQSSGNCCAKSQASLQAAYHPDRMHYPMKRTAPKGEDGAWERISWDEAVSTTVNTILQNQAKYGVETYFSMGGTSRIWAMAPYSALKTLFGSPNAIQANEICKGPRFYATKIDAYNAYSWMEVVGRPRVFVQWGGASELSNYDDSSRTTVDTAFRADKHIIVDPRMSNLGKEADIWVNLRPGTDGAVANCWTQVIIEKELYDELYVRKWMNAPFLVIQGKSAQYATHSSSDAQSAKIQTRLLKESDIKADGSDARFMVLNELTDAFTYYDAGAKNPGWEGENWVSPIDQFSDEQLVGLITSKPGTKNDVGHVPSQKGLDFTGQSQGFVPDPTPFPDGIYPALYTNSTNGMDVTLADGTTVKVKTVWEMWIDFLKDYTPDKVSEISGVDKQTLIDAAVTYATRVDPDSGYGNGGLQYMLAQEHACNSVQNQRACDLLCGITGNMDIPGGMRGSTPGWPFYDLAQTIPDAKSLTSPKPGNIVSKNAFPATASDCNPSWADAATLYHAIETDDPYVMSCGIGQTGDFMNQSNSTRNYEILQKLDFWCCIDMWMTPITGVSDILMPAAHWLELDCLRKSQGSSGGNGATVKCIDPPGEAEADVKIIMRLYKAANVPFCEGTTDEEKWPIDRAEYACNTIGLHGPNALTIDWDEYKEQYQKDGWWDNKIKKPRAWGTYRRYECGNTYVGGLEAPLPNGGQGWSTTTGKQEIWSTVLESLFPDQGEEFPKWIEPPYSPVSAPDLYTDDNCFNMTTGRRQGTYFHSEHRQLPWCRELWPVPRLEMNPTDAAKLGLDQGDWVWIETNFNGEQRKIREIIDLYYGIAPGVVNAEHQWWYPELDQADRGFRLSGVNNLIDMDAQDRICGSSNLRAYAVKVYKATAENSPFGNPVPCGDDGKEVIHTCDDPRLTEWMPDYEGRE